MLAEGAEVPEVAKALEVSEQTLHRWRAQYGGMKANDVKRLKELERENASLKRIVADKELENLALKEVTGQHARPSATSRRRPKTTPPCGPACASSRASALAGATAARTRG